MEKKLFSMFEYQRFASNARLTELISDTEIRYGSALEDDALWMVNAAGAPEKDFSGEKAKNQGGINHGTEK